MGVKGLTSILRKEWESFSSRVVVNSQSSSKLLVVDGNAFIYHICGEVGLSCWFCTDYVNFENHLLSWLRRLSLFPIRFVFVFDGPLDWDKIECKLSRTAEKINSIGNAISQLQRSENSLLSCHFPWIIPPLAVDICIEWLKKFQIPVLVANHEADKLIASLFSLLPVDGIVSNDSDFLCYDNDNIALVPLWSISFHECESMNPELHFHVLYRRQLATILKFPCLPYLFVVISLVGNDFCGKQFDESLYSLIYQQLSGHRFQTGSLLSLTQVDQIRSSCAPKRIQSGSWFSELSRSPDDDDNSNIPVNFSSFLGKENKTCSSNLSSIKLLSSALHVVKILSQENISPLCSLSAYLRLKSSNCVEDSRYDLDRLCGFFACQILCNGMKSKERMARRKFVDRFSEIMIQCKHQYRLNLDIESQILWSNLPWSQVFSMYSTYGESENNNRDRNNSNNNNGPHGNNNDNKNLTNDDELNIINENMEGQSVEKTSFQSMFPISFACLKKQPKTSIENARLFWNVNNFFCCTFAKPYNQDRLANISTRLQRLRRDWFAKNNENSWLYEITLDNRGLQFQVARWKSPAVDSWSTLSSAESVKPANYWSHWNENNHDHSHEYNEEACDSQSLPSMDVPPTWREVGIDCCIKHQTKDPMNSNNHDNDNQHMEIECLFKFLVPIVDLFWNSEARFHPCSSFIRMNESAVVVCDESIDDLCRLFSYFSCIFVIIEGLEVDILSSISTVSNRVYHHEDKNIDHILQENAYWMMLQSIVHHVVMDFYCHVEYHRDILKQNSQMINNLYRSFCFPIYWNFLHAFRAVIDDIQPRSWDDAKKILRTVCVQRIQMFSNRSIIPLEGLLNSLAL